MQVSCRAAVADRQSAQGMEVVEVDLGTRTYPIYIGSGLLGREDGALLRRHVVGSSALVVTNSKLAGLLLDQTVAALKGGDSKLRVETVVLPDGEAFKNIEVLQKIWDAALEHRCGGGGGRCSASEWKWRVWTRCFVDQWEFSCAHA